MRDAARVIGDADLFKKMEDAQALIRRDSKSHCSLTDGIFADVFLPVVFAASLYF